MIKLPEQEQIVVFSRRHWIVLAAQIAITFFLALLILGLAWLLANLEALTFSGFTLQTSSLQVFGDFAQLPGLVWFGAGLVLLIVWLQFMVAFTDYFLDVWIVTSDRVIDIEQRGLFNREFSEFRLERVQDVTVEVAGIIPTLLHYGDVHIQTAGEEREFIFRQVPYPHRIKDKTLQAYERKLKQDQSRPSHHEPTME